MISITDIFSFILAFLILYFAVALITRFRREDVFKERLKQLMQYKEYLLKDNTHTQGLYKYAENEKYAQITEAVNKIQRIGKDERNKLKIMFDKAGLRSQNAYLVYGISKLAMNFPSALIAGFIVFEFTSWSLVYKISAIIASALIGSYSVDFILQRLIKARQNRIRNALPQALDLMVICTEAGLSLNATVQRVAREFSQISPDLGYELALLSIELNLLPDHAKALQNFSDRMDSPDFKSLVSNLIQAEQYGTPIGQSMKLIAEEFRQDRLLKAEERGAKIPVLLTLPMILFIFPSIYIVILGPAVIQVMDHFR
jgi:tight adherence protein C